MGLEQATAREIVEKAVSHKWGVPEFQRGFVWTPQKVRDLMDSLWRGYPIGSFLVWYAEDYAEAKTAEDSQVPSAWIVDGQQRTTALAILLGRKPYWWEEDWNDLIKKHDIRFNVLAEDEPFFSLRTAAMKGEAEHSWVPVRNVLVADDGQLSEMVQDLVAKLGMPGSKFGMLWTRLDKVRKVRDVLIPVVTVMLEIEDVTEIFARLNSAGTKVTEADIALALAASQNPGWARQEFLPFLKKLEEAGFDIDPNLVFRSCVAIGLGKARLKDVPSGYWKSGDLQGSWIRTKSAWESVIHYVEQHGILSSEVLPTKNALIPLVLLADRFPQAFNSNIPLAWLLCATRSGRYSGSAITTLESDVRAIHDARDGTHALQEMFSRVGDWQPLTESDFLQEYRDRFLRLLLYLVMYQRGARDWLTKEKLGFQGTEILERFNPDWHHIFPRAFLKSNGVPESLWDLFANIAVISPTSNIKFGAKDPMAYLQKYDIGKDLLEEQFVPADSALLDISQYQQFLNARAAAIADACNRYMMQLMEKLPA